MGGSRAAVSRKDVWRQICPLAAFVARTVGRNWMVVRKKVQDRRWVRSGSQVQWDGAVAVPEHGTAPIGPISTVPTLVAGCNSPDLRQLAWSPGSQTRSTGLTSTKPERSDNTSRSNVCAANLFDLARATTNLRHASSLSN